jgi:hypothetical protein
MSAGVDPWKGIGLTCVAQECCDTGFTYVPSPTNKCVANSKLPTGVKPYDPTSSTSVSSGAASTSSAPGTSNPFAALGGAASGVANYATGSVASVYDSVSNL